MMNYNLTELKAAASKFNPLTSKKSIATTCVDSSSANFTASLEASPAKMVSESIFPQSGSLYEKSRGREQREKKLKFKKKALNRELNCIQKVNPTAINFKYETKPIKDFRNIKPEGAFDFQSEFLSSAFGPRNIVFFTSFLTALNTSTSWNNTISVFTMYLSQVLDTDVVDLILDQYQSAIKPEFGLDFSEVWSKAKSVSGLFKKFKSTEVFKRIRDLLVVCVIAGVIDPHASNVTAKALTLFGVKAQQKLENVGDIFDLITKTIVYFAESGYRIFTNKSISFLFEPMDIMGQYQKVIEYWPICKTGNLMRIHNMDARDFGVMLDNSQKATNGAILEAHGPEKALYMRMANHMAAIRSEYLQCKTDGKLRQAPLVVCIIGDSSVGKSTISNMTAVTILKAMGRPCSSDRVRTYNPTDKYDSWADGLTECLICDDLGALKPEYSDVNPVDFLIRIKNNAPMTATKADVDEKGKIPIDVSLVVVTMNSMESLTTGAACPTAVLRRFDFCIRPFVKPEFRLDPDVNQLDPNAVIHKYGSMAGVPNVWDFQIITPEIRSITNTKGALEYQIRLDTFTENHMNRTETTVEWKMVGTFDTLGMLNYAIEFAKKHKRIQGYVVDTNSVLHETINICHQCNHIDNDCRCGVKPEFGFSLNWSDVAVDMTSNFYSMFYAFPNFLFYSKYTAWLMNVIFSRYLISYYQRKMKYFVLYWLLIISLMAKVLVISQNPITIGMLIFFFYQAVCFFTTVIKMTRDRAFDEILTSKYDFKKYTQVIYSARVKCAGLICVAAYGVYKFYELFKAYGIMHQSALDPLSKDEKDDRLVTDNPWADVHVSELPVTNKCKTMTAEQLYNAVKKNLVYVEWKSNGVRSYCDGFFVTSNYVLLPWHMMPDDSDVCVKFIRGEAHVVNTSFESYCNFAHAVHIPGTDFALIQVQSAPSFASCIELFPEKHEYISRVVTEIHRNDEGCFQYDTYRVNNARVSNNAEGFNRPIFIGSMHKTTKCTFDGRCMSIQIANTKFPYIYGFHLGGDDMFTAVSGSLVKEQITHALQDMSFILPEAASGDLPKTICGVDILTSNDVHERCATRFLPKELHNTIEVYGSSPGASTPKSDVVDTIISDDVYEVCGVENVWGPPPFNSRRDHSRALGIAANNCIGFKPSAVEWAINDYVSPLIQRFKECEVDIRPLTHMETINGIPGRRFVDKIVRNTSIGFPRTGKKVDYMIPMEPMGEWSDPMDLDEETMAEVERMLCAYRKGERAYSPAKTSLKDEPTKKTKTKCRIFYVTNTALQYLVRKYFLTICAAYSTFPLLSNCAVGINRQGPEWEEMMDYVRQHGNDQIFAGDYSSFDLNMPCQMVRAAFAVHLHVAEAFGYDSDALTIMRGLAADLCNPIISWNGTLIQLGSLHMSGNNLTVYNGSIVNNLYLRCHYFESCDPNVPFRENANMLTYGDDIIGSVSPKLENFDHITFRDYLAKHGMKFTMPDKESEATRFMNIDETDFLKCVNRFDPDLGHNVAQLSEASIFKSLHSVLRSKFLSEKEIAATNIEGALREWFFHGREKYDARQREMIEIVDRHDLGPYMRDYKMTFDARVAAWKQKYEPSFDGQSDDNSHLNSELLSSL